MAYNEYVAHVAAQLHIANQLTDENAMRKKVDSLVAPLRSGAQEGRLGVTDLSAYLRDIRRIVESTSPPLGTTRVTLRKGGPNAALDLFVARIGEVLGAVREKKGRGGK
jgi:hypothetical protein